MGDPITERPNLREAKEAFDPFLTASRAKTLRDGIAEHAKQHNVKLPPGFIPSDAQLENFMGSLRSGLGLPGESNEAFEVKSQVSSEQIPVHSETHSSQGANSSGPALQWLRLPETGAARDILRSMTNEAFPQATAAQDSLNLFAKSSSNPSGSFAETLTSSAALLLPKTQIQTGLITCSEKLPTPELSKALSLLQIAIPTLIQSGDTATLEPLMHKWLSANGSGKTELINLFGALVEIFQQDGLGSMHEAQQCLANLIEHSGLGELIADDSLALKDLNHQLQETNLSGLQLMGGLREFFGGNSWQGIGQFLQPLLRLFAGLFLSKPQNQFPNCLPDERAMTELAAIFANASRKSESPKTKKRLKRKSLSLFSDHLEEESNPTFSEEESYEIRKRVPAFV